jgi:hypothetical protein
MKNKFERYLSTNVPSTALEAIKLKNNNLTVDYTGKIAVGISYLISF